MTGIYISTVVLSCILGIALYFTNTKINKNNVLSFFLTIGVLYLVQDFIAARAQLVTFILFVLEILFVECFLESKKKRYAIGLMVIACLIANLHAAVFYFFFILLLPYIAEYLIVVIRDANILHRCRVHHLNAKIKKLSTKENKKEKLEEVQNELIETENRFLKIQEKAEKRKENPYKIKLVKRENVKWLILIMILCFAMGLLTPIGDEPYTHIFKLMSGTTTDNISEHQPLTLVNHTGAITVIILLLGLLMFTDTKISLKDGFMIAGLLVLTFMSRRQFSMLVIIGVFSFTRLVCDFIGKYDKGWTKRVAKSMTSLFGKVITLAVVLVFAYNLYYPKMDDKYVSTRSYPVELADYILEEVENGNLSLDTMKLYNDYNYGSYLLFRGIPVFIDSRADLYSPEFNEGVDIFSDYINISGIATYYEDKFEEYGITHVIVYENSKLNMLLSRDDNYNELYSDAYFVFYERLST